MITFLALAHMLDATQVVWGGGGMITFLALAHMLDATQMVWGGGGDNVSRRTLSHLVNKKLFGAEFQAFQNGVLFTCYSNILQFPL